MIPHIVFLDRGSLPVPVPSPDFPHSWQEFPSCTPAALVAAAQGADIVITNKVAIDAAALAELPGLRMIAVAASGVNHIDLDACKARGIAVANIRHYGDDSVAEHAFMLMLALRRNLPAYQRDVAAGLWEKSANFCLFASPVRDLSGARLGIFGRGGIGLALAARARAFGMEVVFAERRGVAVVRDGYTDFDTVLTTSDVLSLHCPLSEDSRGMLGEAELMRVKPGAILINTARGGLVDEASVVAALKYGQLGGAGFDVLSEEPGRSDHPLLRARLPNLIVTPHVAWASQEAMSRLAGQLVANIASFVAGGRQNRVV
ncbi:D-2-hydroxyacid dehydrogenase [Craterilacuibacter sp.]|uniref:D-2-hydroxyacid dehydrogenase n=1 Tax=Craterilacuibacter sp. TaxID=2870909 RepID=UPI003F2DC5FF